MQHIQLNTIKLTIKNILQKLQSVQSNDQATKEFTKARYNVKTILVKRDSVKHITSNMADKNVYNYDYDIVINNDGDIKELRNKGYLDQLKDYRNELVSKRLSLEERLDTKIRRNLEIQIAQAAGTQPIVQDNGMFFIYNLK